MAICLSSSHSRIFAHSNPKPNRKTLGKQLYATVTLTLTLIHDRHLYKIRVNKSFHVTSVSLKHFISWIYRACENLFSKFPESFPQNSSFIFPHIPTMHNANWSYRIADNRCYSFSFYFESAFFSSAEYVESFQINHLSSKSETIDEDAQLPRTRSKNRHGIIWTQ